jgi:hypothetical protein
MTERQIQAMIEALKFYANRDNWRSGVDHLSLTRLDPEHVPASMTGRETAGIVGGWEVAEHALKGSQNKPQKRCETCRHWTEFDDAPCFGRCAKSMGVTDDGFGCDEWNNKSGDDNATPRQARQTPVAPRPRRCGS